MRVFQCIICILDPVMLKFVVCAAIVTHFPSKSGLIAHGTCHTRIRSHGTEHESDLISCERSQ